MEDILKYINQRESHIDKITRLYSKIKILGYLESNLEKIWIGYWIPQGLILQDLLFEIKIYPVDQTKLYSLTHIQIKSIDWIYLEPQIQIIP